MAAPLNLTGQRFGSLVAIRPTKERQGGSVVWECACDCGNKYFVHSVSLRSGNTKSCGCLHKEVLASLWRRNRKYFNQGDLLAAQRRCHRGYRKKISDSYVRQLLKEEKGSLFSSGDHIPQNIIDLKRNQIKIHRRLKKLKGELNGTNREGLRKTVSA